MYKPVKTWVEMKYLLFFKIFIFYSSIILVLLIIIIYFLLIWSRLESLKHHLKATTDVTKATFLVNIEKKYLEVWKSVFFWLLDISVALKWV